MHFLAGARLPPVFILRAMRDLGHEAVPGVDLGHIAKNGRLEGALQGAMVDGGNFDRDVHRNANEGILFGLYRGEIPRSPQYPPERSGCI